MPSRPTNDKIRTYATRGGARNAARAAASGNAPKKPRKRKMSKKKRAMYRRRRLIVFGGALLALALIVFCIYSIARGVGSAHAWLGSADRMSVSRSAAPSPAVKSKVAVCSDKDIELELVPASTTVPVGGSLEFTAKMTYVGKDPEGCYVDGADDGRVLVITSGDDTVWRSDACEDGYRPLLLMESVDDEQKMTWNTNRSGDECVADAELPKVDRGTYVAQLELADDPKVTSKPVTIEVQ